MKAQTLKSIQAGRRCVKNDFRTACMVALVIAVIGNHLSWYSEYTLDMAFIFWFACLGWRVPFLLIAYGLSKGEEKKRLRAYLVGYGLFVAEPEANEEL